jgi:hypothetical protein
MRPAALWLQSIDVRTTPPVTGEPDDGQRPYVAVNRAESMTSPSASSASMLKR